MNNELQNIISGKGTTGSESIIVAAARYLAAGQNAGGKIEPNEFTKEQEATQLIKFITDNKLWYPGILKRENKIGEGAEQKVFLEQNGTTVVKINDAVFYLSWIDYFNSLLLHNYYFPDTAYTFIGFHTACATLFAVVEQPFVQSDSLTNLADVKTFMEQNGFRLKKANDYYHAETGLILEDLHEGNVLTQNGILYFVDTVFYLPKRTSI